MTCKSVCYTKLYVAKSRYIFRGCRPHKYSTVIKDAKPFKSIPGLSSLPYIGVLHHFLPVIGQFGSNVNIFQVAGALHKKFGPIVRMKGVFGRVDTVLLFDPAHIHQVYRSQESNPMRPGCVTLEYYREVMKKDMFKGIYGLTTAQGQQWRDFRTKVNPAMLKPKLVKVYEAPLNEVSQDFVQRISAAYIEEAKKRVNERRHDVSDDNKSIIEKLLAIDVKVANVMANEMLFAGIDTVAFTLVNILYHLACNPDKQEKLREEMQSDSTQKRYLRACIKEALRIWPVVPSNLRRTDKDHVVAGYHIPPGVDVLAPNQYLSSLDKHYPRAKEFLPERWLVDKTDPLYFGNAHPMVTMPFGFGVRSCIGRRIAELEIELLLKNMIDEFKITWDGAPIKMVNKFVNNFEKPFNFRFESAK